MWTERDITVAKTLVDPETLAFLRKVFIETHTSNGDVLEKNIVALDNERYGELMKVLHLTKQESKAKIDLIQKIAKTKPEGKAPTKAPR